MPERAAAVILDPIKAAVAPYMLAIKAGVAGLLLLTAFIGGCQVNAGKLADEQAAHKATKASHVAVLRDLANKTKAAEAAVKAASEQAKADRKTADERFKDARHEADQAKRELARALRAGTGRLRDEFTCPAARPAEGGATAPAGGQDGEAQLRRAREEAISDDIAEADEADRWIGWLQAELISTRKACGADP